MLNIREFKTKREITVAVIWTMLGYKTSFSVSIGRNSFLSKIPFLLIFSAKGLTNYNRNNTWDNKISIG